jgi:hypothetical protein
MCQLCYNRKNIGQNQGCFHEIVISIAKKYHNNLDLALVHDIKAKICINFFLEEINFYKYNVLSRCFYLYPHTDNG